MKRKVGAIGRRWISLGGERDPFRNALAFRKTQKKLLGTHFDGLEPHDDRFVHQYHVLETVNVFAQ